MRKEQKRNLVLAAVLVLVLFAADLCLAYGPGTRPEASGEMIVYRMDPEQVEAISYLTKDGEEVSLRKRDGIWTWQEDETFPLNQNFPENMLKKAAVLSAVRVVGEGQDALHAYGLEAPSNRIRLRSQKEEKLILLGDENSATGERYLQVSGSEKVYLADPSFAKLFSTGLYEMASRETMPGIRLETIRELTVQEGDAQFCVRRRETTGSGTGGWEVRQSQDGGTARSGSTETTWQQADEALVSQLLSKLISLRYEKMVLYHPESSQMAAYGLDRPELVLQICYEEDGQEKQYVLLVGGQEEEGRRYVRAENGQGIYVAGYAGLDKFFHLEPEAFLTLNIAPVKADVLSKLSITVSSRKAEFEIRRGEDGSRFYFWNGTELTEKEFNSVYYPLYVFSAEKRVSDMAGQLTEEPVAVLYYGCLPGQGEDLLVELVPYDQNYDAVRINGSARLLANRQRVRGLLDALEAYLQ